MSDNLKELKIYTVANRMYFKVDGKYIYLGTYNIFANNELATQIFEDNDGNKHQFFIDEERGLIDETIWSNAMIANNVEKLHVQMEIATLRDYMALVDEYFRNVINADIRYISTTNVKTIMNLKPKYIDSYGTFEISPYDMRSFLDNL